MKQQIDRAVGCLLGIAIGDALGMPASFMSPTQIKKEYGRITDFLAPSEQQVAHQSLQAGGITDDTQESLIIASVLLEAKRFEQQLFIEKMKEWALEHRMLESTVIGPSTRKFLETVIEGGDVLKAGRTGDTNGAAMRVAPIGIFYHRDLSQAIEAAIASAVPSHGSKPGVASACAIAAAVAKSVAGGYTPQEIMETAIEAAEQGEASGYDIPAPSVSARIRLAKELVDRHVGQEIDEIAFMLYQYIGAGMKAYESIPLALGVFYAAEGQVEQGITTVVNIGDDADTNGAIVGALCGAYSGAASIPKRWRDKIQQQHSIPVLKLAQELITQKRKTGS